MVSSFSVRMAIRSRWISFAKNLFSLLRSSHSFKNTSSEIHFGTPKKYKCRKMSAESSDLPGCYRPLRVQSFSKGMKGSLNHVYS